MAIDKWIPKPGEKVICIKNHYSQFSKGKVYIVRNFTKSGYDDSGTIGVTMDDVGNTRNGWGKQFFLPYGKATIILYRDKK